MLLPPFIQREREKRKRTKETTIASPETTRRGETVNDNHEKAEDDAKDRTASE